jgi:hypothetical protein
MTDADSLSTEETANSRERPICKKQIYYLLIRLICANILVLDW